MDLSSPKSPVIMRSANTSETKNSNKVFDKRLFGTVNRGLLFVSEAECPYSPIIPRVGDECPRISPISIIHSSLYHSQLLFTSRLTVCPFYSPF
jgi:hypothetical protein